MFRPFHVVSCRFMLVLIGCLVLLGTACSPAGSIRDDSGQAEYGLRASKGAPRDDTGRSDDSPDQAEPGDDAGGGDQASSPVPVEDPPSAPADPDTSTADLRVAQGSEWVGTGCPMTPEDSFWRTPVSDLPELEPNGPEPGTSLADFPLASDGSDPLVLRPGLRSTVGKTITWADSDDPLKWVRVEGDWSSDAEFTAIDSIQVGPVAIPTAGLLRHRVPGDIQLELSSEDDHALFVDTDACTLTEYIGWSRFPGTLAGRKATLNDLSTNERRLSVRPGWQSSPTNATDGGSIDSPVATSPVPLLDFEVSLFERPRKGTGASGGSAIPTTPGMVRLEEVFLNPLPGDTRVAPDAHIDHAITVGLPKQHISDIPEVLTPATPAPFVWPALVSDGCGGGTCPDGSAGSEYHFPMGSRFRLGEEACGRDWVDPQSAVIVEAMCTYGIVVTDSSNGFSMSAERSPAGGELKWTRTAQEELRTLTLRDFELVDTRGIAAVDPDALWEGARTWAGSELGFGTTLHGGWYTGRFWNAVLGCERLADHTRCADPNLERIRAVVNGPDWFRAG